MAIRSIEIICIPCEKCERAKRIISEVMKAIEIQFKTKIVYDFKHTTTIANITNYGINPSRAPAILINGRIEAAGRVEHEAMKKRLQLLHSTA